VDSSFQVEWRGKQGQRGHLRDYLFLPSLKALPASFPLDGLPAARYAASSPTRAPGPAVVKYSSHSLPTGDKGTRGPR